MLLLSISTKEIVIEVLLVINRYTSYNYSGTVTVKMAPQFVFLSR